MEVKGVSVGTTPTGDRVILVQLEIVIPVPDDAVDPMCAALRGIAIQPFVPGPGHPDFKGGDAA